MPFDKPISSPLTLQYHHSHIPNSKVHIGVFLGIFFPLQFCVANDVSVNRRSLMWWWSHEIKIQPATQARALTWNQTGTLLVCRTVPSQRSHTGRSCCFFIFHLVQCIVSISSEASSLAHGLFRHMLFSFEVFGDFPVVFLLLISSLIPLWLENTICMILVLLKLLSLS